MGRLEKWSDDKKSKAIAIVLERIEDGESMRAVLDLKRDKEILPSRRLFSEWLNNDTKLSSQYARSCKERADKIFDDILLIADETENDNINGVLNSEAIQRSRLRVDARKWALSKMNPKKYGDKMDLTTKGDKIEIPLFPDVSKNNSDK